MFLPNTWENGYRFLRFIPEHIGCDGRQLSPFQMQSNHDPSDFIVQSACLGFLVEAKSTVHERRVLTRKGDACRFAMTKMALLSQGCCRSTKRPQPLATVTTATTMATKLCSEVCLFVWGLDGAPGNGTNLLFGAAVTASPAPASPGRGNLLVLRSLLPWVRRWVSASLHFGCRLLFFPGRLINHQPMLMLSLSLLLS